MRIILNFYIFASLLCAASSTSSINSRVDELQAKYEDLEERIEKQEEDERRLKTVLQTYIEGDETATPSVTVEDTVLPTVETRPVGTTTQNIDEDDELIIKLVDAERREYDKTYHYTIRYIPLVDDVTIVYPKNKVTTRNHFDFSFYEELQPIQHDDGTMSVTLEKSVPQNRLEMDEYPPVHFISGNERITVRLSVRRSTTSANDTLTSALHLPSFEVSPNTIILYGSDGTSELITVNSSTNFINLEGYFSGFRGDEERSTIMKEYIQHSKMFHTDKDYDMVVFGGFPILNGTLNMSANYEEGFIEFTGAEYLSAGGAVLKVEVSTTRIVRPAGSDEDNFGIPASFVIQEYYTPLADDGSRLIYCPYSETEMCDQIIDILTRETIELQCKRTSTGIKNITITESNYQLKPYIKQYLVSVQATNRDVTEATIECTIYVNASPVTSMNMTTRFFIEATVLTNRSSAVVQYDGIGVDNSATGNMTATCVVAGRPTPGRAMMVVKFQTNYGYDYTNELFFGESGNITVSDDGLVITLTKTFEIFERVHHATCVVEQCCDSHGGYLAHVKGDVSLIEE